MGDFSAWDITDDFVEAVHIWSEHLTGARGTDWGTLGAFHLFVDLGMQAPQTPAPIDVIVGMRCMAQEAARMRSPNATIKASKTKQMAAVTATVNAWLQTATGSSFDVNMPPTDAISTTIPDLATAITGAQAIYGNDPRSAIAGFDVTQAAAQFDYSQIPAALDTSVPKEMRDLVDNQIDSDYWSPPPPETHFDSTYGDIA